tara:strand:+ start:1424 stop:2608 length:1185 start_codon:yes stop_codon:yes gene_type:complete
MKWFSYLKNDSKNKINKLNQINLINLPTYKQNEFLSYYNELKLYFNNITNITPNNTIQKDVEKWKHKYIGGNRSLENQNLDFQTIYLFDNQKIIFHHKKNNHSYENLLLKRIMTLFKFYNYDNKTEISVITNSMNRRLNKQRSYNINQDLKIMKEKSIANISSGVTTSDGKLIVSRTEELPKLLVHELIHLMGLDGNLFNPAHHHIRNSVDQLSNYYLNNFCVKKNIRSVAIESYTETLSNILNCMFFSMEIPNGNFKVFIETLELERQYSIYQTAKLLYFFGFNNFDEFFIQCSNDLNHNKRVFFTDTLYLDYTIIRSIIFYRFDDILSTLNISKNKFNIPNSSNNFYDKLLLIIDDTINNNSEFKNILNNYLTSFKSHKDLDIGYTCIDIKP